MTDRTSKAILTALVAACILTAPVATQSYSMEGGGGGSDITLENPNALDRAIECEIDNANKVAEARKELNLAKAWRAEYQKTLINENLELRGSKDELKKERRSKNPDKGKISKLKKHIKDLKASIRKNTRDLKKIERIIVKQNQVIQSCQ